MDAAPRAVERGRRYGMKDAIIGIIIGITVALITYEELTEEVKNIDAHWSAGNERRNDG